MKTLFLTLLLLIVVPRPSAPQQCNECHSKNPKLVKMHEALGFQKCGMCHKGGREGVMKKRPPEEVKKQMAEDPLCTGCHGKKR